MTVLTGMTGDALFGMMGNTRCTRMSPSLRQQPTTMPRLSTTRYVLAEASGRGGQVPDSSLAPLSWWPRPCRVPDEMVAIDVVGEANLPQSRIGTKEQTPPVHQVAQ